MPTLRIYRKLPFRPLLFTTNRTLFSTKSIIRTNGIFPSYQSAPYPKPVKPNGRMWKGSTYPYRRISPPCNADKLARVRALVIHVAGDIMRRRRCFTWLYRHHNALRRSSDPSFALTTTSTDVTLRISISLGRSESPLGVGSTELACCSMLQTDAVS